METTAPKKKGKQADLTEVVVVKEALSRVPSDAVPLGIVVKSGLEIINTLSTLDFFVGYVPFTPTLERNKTPFVCVTGQRGTLGIISCVADALSHHKRLDLSVKQARRFKRGGIRE